MSTEVTKIIFEFRDDAGELVTTKKLKHESYAKTWAKQRGYTVTKGADPGPFTQAAPTVKATMQEILDVPIKNDSPIPLECPVCGAELVSVRYSVYKCDKCNNRFAY